MKEFITQYWVQTLFVGMITAATWIFNVSRRKLICRFNEHDMLKLGLQSLLRSEIIKSYNYYKEKGYCPIYAKDSIAAMGRSYHDLGGNGTTVRLLEEVAEMPTEKRYIHN